MKRTPWWLAMGGLVVLAWNPPVPQSEAGKPAPLPRAIVLKGQPDMKAFHPPSLPSEIAKAAKVRPTALSSAERMALLRGGDGLLPKLPKLKVGATVATNLKLTPRQPYVAGAGYLSLAGIAWYWPEQNYVTFRSRSDLPPVRNYQVEFWFKPAQAGKRYLIEFGISNVRNLEFTLYTNYGMQQVRNPGPTIPILFDAPDTQEYSFALNCNTSWNLYFCEVTTLN